MTRFKAPSRLLTCALAMALATQAAPLRAQSIEWTDVTASSGLPDGVRLFEGSRQSPALKAWMLEIDTQNESIALVPYAAAGFEETITAFSKRKNVYAAVNAGFFGAASSYSSLVLPGEVAAVNIRALTRFNQSYPVIRSMFGIRADRSMSIDWVYHFNNDTSGVYRFDAPMPYAYNQSTPLPAPKISDGQRYPGLFMGVGGGPVLVKGDSVHVTYDEEIFWGSGVNGDSRQPRTAAGYTADGRAILLVADGRQGASLGLTLAELAQLMNELGCVEAINLDGGGSSQMTVGDRLVNRPEGGTYQRPVATFLAVTHPDSIPNVQTTEFEYILDTEYEQVSTQGTWGETANAGFYGTSKSLITQGGDGSKTVTYLPELPGSGNYELFGWWTASSNRSKRAAYVVTHSGGTDTLRADQSVSNAQWVRLGELAFSGTGDDRVVISNIGTDPASYVVADAIRFTAMRSTSVESVAQPGEWPAALELRNAFPNPFNPAVTLSFAIREAGSLRVEAYDLAGRLVDILLDGQRAPGAVDITWAADGLASGAYLIKAEHRNGNRLWTVTRQVTLLK